MSSAAPGIRDKRGLAGAEDEAPRLGREVGPGAGRKGLPGQRGCSQVVCGAEVHEEGLTVCPPDADGVTLHMTVEDSGRMGGVQGSGQPGKKLKHLP